jgi:FkbM family methyltransferase
MTIDFITHMNNIIYRLNKQLKGVHVELFKSEMSDYIEEHQIKPMQDFLKSCHGMDVDENTVRKLLKCHKHLTLKNGTFEDELPEQVMALTFLTGDEKVLELGGNIGRNSLIISTILKDSSNLVVTESDADIAERLRENRDLNDFKFQIINKALSNRNLIQRGWSCFESDVLLPGYKNVNVISYANFKLNYDIKFDTLIIDCEGAFYHILIDMIDILNGIKTIIIENDFHNYSHKLYVDQTLKQNNFKVVYSSPLLQYPGLFPETRNEFYQVWKKD